MIFYATTYFFLHAPGLFQYTSVSIDWSLRARVESVKNLSISQRVDVWSRPIVSWERDTDKKADFVVGGFIDFSFQ